jgi:hypothetical protein
VAHLSGRGGFHTWGKIEIMKLPELELTPERKAAIDAMSMMQLLSTIRFSPMGDIRLRGAHGDYIMTRYAELRKKNPGEHVQCSKDLGW